MEDLERTQEGTLADQAQEQNSTLKRLIEVVAQLIGTSRELLARLQPGDKAVPPTSEPETGKASRVDPRHPSQGCG